MRENSKAADVSVIVVCYNEEENIGDCLKSLVKQVYETGRYEVVVVDGGSADGTIGIARSYEEQYPFIRVIVEPRKGTAVARNTGLRASRFGFVAFLDADCVATRSWLSTLVGVYRKATERDPDIAVVGGGSIIPEGSKPFVEALKIALNTYIGSGGRVTGRYHPRERFVDDLPSMNVIYPRSLFREIGFFNDSLMDEGEDADFSYRILKAGMKLMYSPLPVVYHKYRPDPLSWWRNMRRYDRARATLIIADPSMVNFHYLGPLMLVISLIFSPLAIRWPVFLLPLAYFPFVLLTSCYEACRKGKPRLIFSVFGVYCLTHVGYGIGEIEGFLRGLARMFR